MPNRKLEMTMPTWIPAMLAMREKMASSDIPEVLVFEGPLGVLRAESGKVRSSAAGDRPLCFHISSLRPRTTVSGREMDDSIDLPKRYKVEMVSEGL